MAEYIYIYTHNTHNIHNIVYIYHNFFIHLAVDGHLGCFHALTTVNSAASVGLHFAGGRKDVTSKMLKAVRVRQVSVTLCHFFCLHKNPTSPGVSGGQGWLQ